MRAWMLCLWAPAVAHAGTASFDMVAEGTTTTQLTEDGVVLSHLDQRMPPPSNSVMVAEDASDSLAGMAGYSPANVLGFGGYAPGPAAAFGRFGELRITPVDPADTASVEVFHLGNAGVTLTLEAWAGGVMLDSDTITLQGWSLTHQQLHLATEPFDFLRLVAGTAPSDVAFIAIDDVHVELSYVPADSDTDTGEVQPVVVDSDLPDTDETVDLDTTDRSVDDPVDTPADDNDTDITLPDPFSPPPGCGCDSRGSAPLGLLALVFLPIGLRRRRS